MKLFLAVVVLCCLSLGVYIFADIARQPASVITTTVQTEATTAPVVTIARTNAGYEPNELVVTKGTIVIWTNETNGFHWPASDSHPVHDVYPEFDPKRPLAPGEEWRFVFEVAGEWGFHDHIHANKTGTILVEDPTTEMEAVTEGQVIDEVTEVPEAF